jgi:WXG100 family type VII secretion target
MAGAPEPSAVAFQLSGVFASPLPGNDGLNGREKDFMPQAIVDPEELRRFAQNLRKFSSEVQERVTSLGAQMVALERTWRDQEQKKFSEEFEQHMRTIARFVEVIEHHIPYLNRKAEIIDEYLQQR